MRESRKKWDYSETGATQKKKASGVIPVDPCPSNDQQNHNLIILVSRLRLGPHMPPCMGPKGTPGGIPPVFRKKNPCVIPV